MYSIGRAALTGPTGRAELHSSCALRSRSSALQRILDEHQKAKDTSEKWKRSAKAHVAPRNGGPAYPFAKSAVQGSSGPSSAGGAASTATPYYLHESVLSWPRDMAPSRNSAPSAPISNNEQPSAGSAQPRPASGGARFFFMGAGGGSAAQLPSVEWAARRKQELADRAPQVAEPAKPTVQRFNDLIRPGPVAAAPARDNLPSSRPSDVAAEKVEARATASPARPQQWKRPSEIASALAAQQALRKTQTQPIQPAAPMQPTQPVKPAQPTRPVTPAQATRPVTPMQPARRETPMQPTRPEAPARTKQGGAAPRRVGKIDKKALDGDGDGKQRRRKRFKLPQRGKEVTLPLTITVDGLAKLLEVPNDHLLRKMANLGMDKLASDYLLSNEEAADVALEYGVVPIIPEDKGPELHPRAVPEDMSVHPQRPPVVTIMGHVDHGKTTLLDTLRSSSITASEAGGITQHIGAFSVAMKDGQHITFLDTPGHAAFSAMRARGANATDIVVLVVAADDGVMPQTKEAIQHALDADVPIIVAINKCDKPGVDPSLIKEELLQYGVQTEDMGGDIQAVEISALKGDGVEELAENIVTLSEVLDLRAEVDIPVHATVIESQVEKGRGGVASVLVKRGTLKVGDIIVAGATWCKVRGMSDDRGRAVESAGPATAVKVMGWKDIPQAGDMALQAASEAQAKEVVGNRAEKRKNKARLASLEAMNEKRREVHVREDGERAGEKAYQTAVWEYHNGLRTTYPEKPARPAGESGSGVAEKSAAKGEDEIPVVPIVIKGDVSGTVEAVSAALKKLPSKKIRVSVLSVGVGPVSESDVAMAGSGEQGVVVAFNVKADKKTQSAAKRAGVQIMTFRIIYKLLEEVEQLMLARLPPLLVEEVLGEAVVQEVFEITLKGNKTTNVAGSRVVSGAVARARKARVLRDGKELFMGDISSLKNVKNDIAEATKGQECGISFASFEGLRAGDVVQSVGLREVPQKLE